MPVLQLWPIWTLLGGTCTEPLSDSLKLAKERVNRGIREKQENQLNPNGGAGGKGAYAPQAMPAKANLAKAQN